MARGKEVSVVLLDVGPRMESCLDYAKRAVSNFLLSKMLNKPGHEVSLVLYGTTGHDNLLFNEFAAQGDETQYLNITLAKPLAVASVEHLSTTSGIRTENGSSDCVDALTVAADVLYRAINDRPQLEKATVAKRIILISNFLDTAKEDEGGEFAAVLTERLSAKGMQLDVVSIDEPKRDAEWRDVKVANLEALGRILPEVRHTVRKVCSPVELLGAFRFKEYTHTAYYTGPLTVASSMTISVKVSKKSSQERLPTMDKHSDRSLAKGATHTVVYDRSSRRHDKDEEDLPPEDMGKGYMYGGQIVPLVKEAELVMKYAPEKSFQVLGTVARKSTPHSMFVGDTWLVAPEKGNAHSFAAVSALARSCRDSDLAILTRFVPRLNGDILIGLMTPHNSQQPDTFIMNCLPLEADVRVQGFPSLSEHATLLPHKQQTAAVDGLIDSLMLTQGCREELAPELTGNPSLHHFLSVIGRLALDPESKAPATDPLLDLTLDLQADSRRGLQEALPNVLKQFKVAQKDENIAKAAAAPEDASKADRSGAESGPPGGFTETSSFLSDFDRMLEQGERDVAIAGLADVIRRSVGSRSFSQAVQYVFRLREAAITAQRAQDFNRLVGELALEEDGRAVVVELVTQIGGLIKGDEAAGGVSDTEAEQFRSKFAENKKVAVDHGD